MTARDYVGTSKRTFRSAVVHLLETQYGLLGSRRVLELLANDLEELAAQFHPVPDHISSGWMVFTGTRANGRKAHPGKSVADYELVTIAWPVLLPEDLECLATLPKGEDGKRVRRELFQQRLVRVIEHGLQAPGGPVLLTVSDLAVMFNLSPPRVSELLTEARSKTGKTLLTKGYYFDQGMRPTHKADVIDLYEAGLDETDIARQTHHAQSSVGRYIRDYERVKLLLSHSTPIERIPHLIGLQPNVATAYADLVFRYHPELQPQEVPIAHPA